MDKEQNSDAVMRAALKMAIEAMEYNIEWYNIGDKGIDKSEEAINACKEALASNSEALKQPAWQGLTDDEIEKIIENHDGIFWYVVCAIEQELKTKNGFSDVKEKNT
jgi:hypothetical protein